ncbi:MAG TPA: helix-turn-helix transcriptional regulator [Thermoanaerobaculia bacterium]|nr:helix-turn-helix transcriptional regulator [Thermoanaerobaculia bacterium]
MRKRDRGSAGRVLLECRERRGYTQEELARRSGIGVSSIGALERGEDRPAGEKLVRICIALEIDPEAFLSEIARAEADELKPLVEEMRREMGQVESRKSAVHASGPSDLFFLAARVSHSSGNPGGLDALVRLISRINLSAPIVEPKPGPG